MEISPDKENIKKLFLDTIYNIDFYQREYKWTADPVLRLLDDIFFKFNQEYENHKSLDPNRSTVEEKYSGYYLNTYVTNTVGGKCYIVDGQQRLTTLTIILIKLSHKANDFNCDSGFIEWIKARIRGFGDGGKISFWMNHEQSLEVLENLFENKKEPKDIDVSDSVTSENIIKNYESVSKFLDNQLDDKHRFETFVYYFLYRLVLINLSVGQTEVPMVFEVINDRGVRLKPYEILKGKLLGQIDRSELDEFNQLWESRVKAINAFKEDEIDTFFRYYLRAKYADTRAEGASFDDKYHREMFTNKMNKILKLNHNPSEVKIFLNTTFKYYSALYVKILEANRRQNDIYPSVFINSLTGMDGPFWLILSACKLNDDQEKEKIETVAYETDRLFSLLQLQNSYDSNSFNVLLYKISKEIRGCELDSIRKVFDSHLLTELAEMRNLEAEKIAVFQYRFFRDARISSALRFTRYFFARIEQFFSKNLGLNMKHPIEDLVRRGGAVNGFHIEHILAHNKENLALFDNDEDFFEQERSRLGGILLLRGRDNISSGNEPYSKKLKTYANTLYWNETLRADTYKSNLAMRELQKEFVDLNPMEKFGKEEIEIRQKLLFRISQDIWK